MGQVQEIDISDTREFACIQMKTEIKDNIIEI